ncbi:MAG: orotidine-5'-phosphate decarboxylase [Spirochaetales bacterium]|nr:orotidine-5'-phosphate decarboxylase [Spirochaetales bacterium]
MSYIDKLRKSTRNSGSIICMGLDPVCEYLPEIKGSVEERITSFFKELFSEMIKRNILPGAFKPNLGFFTTLDRPRENVFDGSMALVKILSFLDELFPYIPIILDYKRGDIARSSENYAKEGFVTWGCDSATVSPWMGSDSVIPFFKEAALHNGGVYLLNRTSNPGGKEFQNAVTGENGQPLFKMVAEKIMHWAMEYPGTGAVVGATSLRELEEITAYYSGKEIPLLIPGVGSQGGSATDVVRVLNSNDYSIPLVRINASSGITHPWAKTGDALPANWKQLCIDNLERLNDEAGSFV